MFIHRQIFRNLPQFWTLVHKSHS